MATVKVDQAFESLLDYIRTNRGFDFNGYKRPSLIRRFDKRMGEVGVGDYEEYRDYLERHPQEFVELFNTILINVTAFFRDAPAWEYLRTEIVPRVVEARGQDETIRIWSTGCASGEEAYSLAMVFAETLGEQAFQARVKIYATDIDEQALTEGRHATYQRKALNGMSQELRERYFESVDDRYIFRQDMRRSVIFGRHDLLQDPPISRVDLLSSRNTLMYFNPEAQERILTNFAFALRDTGYLFLGKSEVLMTRTKLFVPLDLKRRVFAKVPRLEPLRPAAIDRDDHEELADLAADVLMREAGFEAAPAAQLVVTPDGRLALANHQARTLFGLTTRDVGRPLKDLEVSFRPVELRSRIEQTYKERHAITLRDVEWEQAHADPRYLDVQIIPLISSTGEVVGIGITFTDTTRYRRLQETVEAARKELESAYDQLQSTVEELETTNEELQSTNEELETTNEELQSTNEELETMNEELQSTNEELETINDELNIRTDELNGANSFLESMLSSISVGVVVIDPELRVTAWNRAAQELWGLREDEVEGTHFMNLDIGLPVEHLRKSIRAAQLGEPAEVVLDAVNRRGRSIRCKVTANPMTDPGGDPRGAILVMEPADEG